MLRVLEGDEPDPEAMPWAGRAELVVSEDGSGILRAALPQDAFHLTGSSASVFAFDRWRVPIRVEDVELCRSNAMESECTDLIQGGSVETTTLPDDPALEAKLRGKATWTATPPSMGNPLEEMTVTSPFNPLREIGDTARAHRGTDLRARTPKEIRAATSGKTVARLARLGSTLSAYTQSNDPMWHQHYLHLSDVIGFEGTFLTGEEIGRALPPGPFDPSARLRANAATARELATYTLTCAQYQRVFYDNNGNERRSRGSAICRAESNRGHVIENLVSLRRGRFSRTVSAGELFAMSGVTGTRAPHLHYEVRYGDSLYNQLDPALFYESISASVNSDSGGRRSPAFRFGAALARPGETTILGVANGLLGPLGDLPAEDPATCPAGGLIPGYFPKKLGGPGSITSVEWELGPCLHKLVCEGETEYQLGFDAQTWRRDPSEDWKLLALGPLQSGSLGTGHAVQVRCCQLTAQDFEGMSVSLPGSLAFDATTMTVTGVQEIGGGIDNYMGGPGGSEVGYLSNMVPAGASGLRVFTFDDGVTLSGTSGFPDRINGLFINNIGRSNLIAVWRDPDNNEWQWVWSISGGTSSNGTMRQYNFVYDSRQTPKMRMDSYKSIDFGVSFFTGTGALPELTATVTRPSSGECIALPNSQVM